MEQNLAFDILPSSYGMFPCCLLYPSKLYLSFHPIYKLLISLALCGDNVIENVDALFPVCPCSDHVAQGEAEQVHMQFTE